MKHTRGFSLIEAMIALGVLLVGMAGIAVSFQAMISKSVASRNQAQAAVIAQSVLSELSDTDPAGWDTEKLAELYMFDYEGNRVTEATDAYYSVSLGTPTKDLGWWNVTIGVTWFGWRDEQSKLGVVGADAQFAYTLDAAVAPYVSSESSD